MPDETPETTPVEEAPAAPEAAPEAAPATPAAPVLTDDEIRAAVTEALGRPIEEVVADPEVPGVDDATMEKLLAGLRKEADAAVKEIEDLGPAITEAELRETAAADPEKGQALLDGHLAAAEEKARAAKKKTIDRIKLLIKIGAMVAGAGAGGPAGGAAAAALTGALDNAGE